MTTPNIESLAADIDKMIEAATFSAAGIKAAEALRLSVVLLEDRLASQSAELKVVLGQRDLAFVEIAESKIAIEGYKTREDVLRKREAEITKLEREAAVAAGREAAFRECFGLVFRNTEVRETFHSQHPVVVPGAGGSTSYINTHDIRTETSKQSA